MDKVPCGSVSMNRTRLPRAFQTLPSCQAKVVLPPPPFEFTKAITLAMLPPLRNAAMTYKRNSVMTQFRFSPLHVNVNKLWAVKTCSRDYSLQADAYVDLDIFMSIRPDVNLALRIMTLRNVEIA